MTTKHTQGPWMQISETIICDRPDSNMISARICDVARINNYKANALLIAAAPELLAELQELRDWVEHVKKSNGFSRDSISLGAEQSIKKADALIAKAKGE